MYPRLRCVRYPTRPGRRGRLARDAAQKAALVSGSLALPPGPLGMLTVLPDLLLIWKLQRQMVADIFALHGRTAELTRHAHAVLPVPAPGEPRVARCRRARRPAPVVSAALGRRARGDAVESWASASRSEWRGRRQAAGCRSPARRPSAPTRTGTRCRWRSPRAACSMPSAPGAGNAAREATRGRT